MTERRRIYCCACAKDVLARLTSGAEVYPHRRDLSSIPFWMCDACRNFVGCHHQTRDRTRPLGVIPTAELKRARNHIHALLDPLWKSGRWRRRGLYAAISHELGWEYHTAELRNLDDARRVYRIVRRLAAEPRSEP